MHWSEDPSPLGNSSSLQTNTQTLSLVNLSSLLSNRSLLVCWECMFLSLQIQELSSWILSVSISHPILSQLFISTELSYPQYWFSALYWTHHSVPSFQPHPRAYLELCSISSTFPSILRRFPEILISLLAYWSTNFPWEHQPLQLCSPPSSPISQDSEMGLDAVLLGSHCYFYVTGPPLPSSLWTDFHTLLGLDFGS